MTMIVCRGIMKPRNHGMETSEHEYDLSQPVQASKIAMISSGGVHHLALLFIVLCFGSPDCHTHPCDEQPTQ